MYLKTLCILDNIKMLPAACVSKPENDAQYGYYLWPDTPPGSVAERKCKRDVSENFNLRLNCLVIYRT